MSQGSDNRTTSVRVWDLPTRMVHWGLVLAIAAAWYFQWKNEMTWHMYAGYAAATLVVFRLVWGLVGSETARFAQFVRGPGTVVNYLRTGARDRLGHNPLGALSVVALLMLVLLQAGSGLFANDDIFFDGPWAGIVTKDTSDAITSYHRLNKTILLVVIGLHVAAIAWYRFRGERLVGPMLTGRKRVAAGTAEPRHRPLWLAALALALAAAAVGVAFRFWWL